MRRAGSPPLPMLAALCALPPLSIDMSLPSLPASAIALGVPASSAALTITLFMAGFALSPIAYGAFSDRWGRRPLLLVGLMLFALGGAACVVAPSLGWLLLARLAQGAGAGCGPTLAFAATRDRLEGARLGQRLALLTMLLNTAPVVAPSLGTLCLDFSGFRGVYEVLASGGALLLLWAWAGFAETRRGDAASASPSASPFASLRADAEILLCQPAVLFPGLIYGLSAGSMFAYVSASPLLVMQGLGATPMLYAGLFALTGGGIVAGAFLSGRALRVGQPARLIGMGLVLSIAGPVVAALLLAAGMLSLAAIMAALIVATFGYGLIAPAAAHATLDPVPDRAGSAAALMNSFQMACMALASLAAATLYARLGIIAPPVVMVSFALASAACLGAWRMR